MEAGATVTIATLLSSIGEVFTTAIGWAAVLRNSACRSWRWSVQASAERLTVSRWGAILPRTSPFSILKIKIQEVQIWMIMNFLLLRT